uniref:Pepdidase_M14_N domain-containing protein n=1 Tax=Panagrellus redivivus TaxID=6233 RepID=A0A7E4VT98_PANRE
MKKTVKTSVYLDFHAAMALALQGINFGTTEQPLYIYGPLQIQMAFNELINRIMGGQSSEEQTELAQHIQVIFTKEMEDCEQFYAFMVPTQPKKVYKKRRSQPKKTTNNDKDGNSSPKAKKVSERPKSTSKSPSRRGSTTSANKLITDVPTNPLVNQDFIVDQVLKAIQFSSSCLATIMLARLLSGYAAKCKDTVGQNRLRRLARLDATNHCFKALFSMLRDPNPSPLHIAAIDCLANALIHVSSKDSKIHLKMRLSGLLPLLTKRVMKGHKLFVTPTLLKFINTCGIRSVRNAQAMGHEKDFPAKLVSVCKKMNKLEIDATKEAKLFVDGRIPINDCNYCARVAYEIDSYGNAIQFSPEAAAEGATNKLLKLLEMLYLLIKNKKNKTLLIEHDILPVLVNIFHNHFARRYESTLHVEILSITVASIRQFSRNRKGKDALLSQLYGRQFVEASIRTLNAESNAAIDRKSAGLRFVEPGIGVDELPDSMLDQIILLQDSLCALSMRWMPELPFPMAPRPFSLQFPLPIVSNQTAMSTSAPKVSGKGAKAAGKASATKPGAVKPTTKPTRGKSTILTQALRNSSGKPVKSSREATPTPTTVETAADNEPLSSDDDGADEEDATLMYINRRDGDDVDMMSPASEEEVDSDTGLPRQRGTSGSSESDGPSRRKLRSNDSNVGKDPADVLKYSAQKLSELASHYQDVFKEYEEGALPMNLTPKHRKLAAGKKNASLRSLVVDNCQKTLSVADFVKIPYPDLCDIELNLQQQEFHSNSNSMREAMLHRMARCNLENLNFSKVVFDLDDLTTAKPFFMSPPPPQALGNDDLNRIGHLDPEVNHLKFESRFESGNLRRAIHVADRHYELIISPDINQQSRHFQWFYFEVSNNKANVPYTFEIINSVKKTSMFSNGMQPVLFSVTEAQQGRAGWVRAGSSVCYYRNCYVPRTDTETEESDPLDPSELSKPMKKLRKGSECGEKDGKENKESNNFFSIRFTINFRHEGDVCYIAYHYPYTYSFLRATLERHLTTTDPSIYVRQDLFTTTLRGNPVPIMTITAPGTDVEVQGREIVIFSARVHPGETNSSWMMHGLLKFLVSDKPEAIKLRELCVFKVIPMLNPDGVINGSHRCSLSGQDLNRTWDRPNPTLHPTIYNTKGIVQYCIDVARKPPFVFVDLHGHSRRCNVFMYGNNPDESWRAADHAIGTGSNVYLALPEILANSAPGFSLKECRFSIAKSKEPSARVALWRQFGLERCYTMESTYAGSTKELPVQLFLVSSSTHDDPYQQLDGVHLCMQGYKHHTY